MAKKLGGILGIFEEMDQKEAHRNSCFLRIKVKMDLKKPLKPGTIVRFKERLGHQLKDCEVIENMWDEIFEDIEDQDLSFGLWLRESPLPCVFDEPKGKDSSSGTYINNIFNISSGQRKCGSKGKY
ncbi:unnamed protein product [Vicia faba]|uniref:Uncharacterized protein n=1 Tax=Vicia faba TaxID=3906 RepID=A0AAV1B748_VICFA|nr:unnamed protein product [Vicia faba]